MQKSRFLTLTLLFVLIFAAISPIAAQDDPVEFMRFFGECEDEYGAITDLISSARRHTHTR